MIEDHWITVIRTNPDAADFIIDRLINQIYMHIIKSTKKNWKINQKSLIDDLSKRLIELEFKSNHLIKPKCLKWIVKKNTTYLIRMVGKIYYQESVFVKEYKLDKSYLQVTKHANLLRKL